MHLLFSLCASKLLGLVRFELTLVHVDANSSHAFAWFIAVRAAGSFPVVVIEAVQLKEFGDFIRVKIASRFPGIAFLLGQNPSSERETFALASPLAL